VNTVSTGNFQTGITVKHKEIIIICKENMPQTAGMTHGNFLTVYGNGHAFGEDEAISTHESRHSAKLVEETIVIRDTFCGFGMDDLDVEVVLFGNGQQGRRARVTLKSFCQMLMNLEELQ
jgi:hypothetical protein